MNRTKKLFVIFLCFLILFIFSFPVKRAEAQSLWERIQNAVTGFFEGIGNFLKKTWECLGDPFACLVQGITWIVHQIFWFFNNLLLAPIIDIVASLNPFQQTETGTSPVSVLWNILVNISFIILSFSALFAGFQWLFGEDALAKRLIFNIIIVALLINFSFVLVKESFNIVQAIERGITGGESRVGSIIAASLWQKNPFEEIKKIMEEGGISGTFGKIFGYLFIIIFDMIIFIVLIITFLLILARYFLIIFLAAVSPLAFASLTFPEFKGSLAEATAGLRQFDNWFGHFIRWLIILPIFIFLVLLGNIIKENTFSQIEVGSAGGLFEFVIVLLFMAFWYLLAIKFAVDFSKGVGALAKAVAIGMMLIPGGLAARGLMMATSGRIGGFLSKMGNRLVEKAPPGFFGAQLKRVGEGARKVGENLVERRYKAEADAVKIDIARYNEQLTKAKTDAAIQQITDNINRIIKKYEKNSYVLKQANEEIKKMSTRNFEKIATSGAIGSLIGADVPLEIRETIIDKLDKVSKGTVRQIYSNTSMLEIFQGAAADIQNKIVSLGREKLGDSDVLKILKEENVRGLFERPEYENFKKSLNVASKGFVEALFSKNAEQISNALSKVSRDFWENSQTIKELLTNYEQGNNIPTIIKQSIIKSSEPQNIINSLLLQSPTDPLRVAISSLPEKEFDNLLPYIRPEDQAKLRSIRGKTARGETTTGGETT